MMVIVILDEFFIHLSDLLISFFIKGIDFIVFILDKFHNKNNWDNDNNNDIQIIITNDCSENQTNFIFFF